MVYRHIVEVKHPGLGKFRVISGTDHGLVNAKADAQLKAWEETYRRKQEVESSRQEKLENSAIAQERTREAQEALEELRSLLKSAVSVNHVVEWDKLYSTAPFPHAAPTEPTYNAFPIEPKPEDAQFQPKLGFLDKMVKARADEKFAASQRQFELRYNQWSAEVARTKQANDAIYNSYLGRFEAWERDKSQHEKRQEEANENLRKQQGAYLAGTPDGISDYCDIVLTNARYPDCCPQDYELEYNPTTKLLLIDYSLPAPDDLPKLKEVRYVKTKDDFNEIFISQGESCKLYDEVVYQICLRVVFELIKSDAQGYISGVVFNGWVTSIDKATGKKVTACIISMQTTPAELLENNLENVDAKACFKLLKGVGSSKLHSITPVAPILVMNREDRRFISPHSVAGQLDERFNLAAMDWEEFEHLIREVFSKEFSASGGEVKVTQASRDGGVDAVAFDPDPIRGGKTVIQAKRYTNTVGVSAVRDLYGTVMNEGASKGILVTTSDYGPDAYEFAKGKPLVLLNGGNLLHLLDKHGHKAKIDLKEAKQILGEKIS